MTHARLAAVTVTVLMTACATTMPLRVPEGPSSPLDAAEATTSFVQASATCRGVRTLTAEVGLSGRVGSRKVRGRVLAGFVRPGSLRLEAPAPFGAPAFVLVARANRAVIWFPRDNRVLNDAAVADVIDALTGMRRDADDLLALLTGCLASEPRAEAAEAKRFESGWIALPLSGGAEAFLRSEQQTWRIVGGRGVGGGGDQTATSWTIAYDEFATGFPARVRVAQAPTTDITFQVSQLETNVAIDPAAFALTVPAGAVPMSLDELRQMGPLADTAARPGSR